MNSLELVELIKDIKEQKNITSDMLENLVQLSTVLRNFSKSQKEIKNLSEEISKIESVHIINEMNTNINSFITNFNESNEIVREEILANKDLVKELSNEYLDHKNKVEDVYSNYKKLDKIVEETRVYADKVELQTKIVSDMLNNEIETKMFSLEEKLGQLIISLDKTNDNMVGKINRIEEMIRRGEDINNNFKESIDLFNSKVNDGQESLVISNEKLVKEISEVVEVNGNLYSVLSTMKRNEEDIFGKFSMLMDKWAADNLHSLAIKKRK